jgi:hypothetical protein
MSLNNIKLPDTIIAELYRQSLVEDDTQPGHGMKKDYTEEVVERPARKEVVAQKKEEPVKEEQKTTGAAKPVTGYKSLGNNKKNITVVVDFANEVFVPESELQFLTKMLGACKLNLADVAIVNNATMEVAIEKLKEQLQPKHLLLFGVEPTAIQLPINFPAYKEQPYAGTTYLYAPGLDVLNKETEEAKLAKRKLWDCLKRIFV